MYDIPPFEAGVLLIRNDGSSQLFRSRRALFECFGWNRLSHGLVAMRSDTPPFYSAIEHGQVLGPADFLSCWLQTRAKMLASRSAPSRGPVPGVHRRRYGGHHRIPGTFGAKRESAFVDVDAGEPQFRAARSWKNLPSSWDDLTRSDWDTKSWKKHRRTQWKG